MAMKIRARLVLWLTLLFQLDQFDPSMGAIDDLPWKNADKLIKAVCPNTNIYEIGDNDATVMNACCDDCTCRDDYGEIPKCFASTSETETCMQPNTKKFGMSTGINQKELRAAYFMITKSPADGCVDANVPPCSDDNILTLAPVSSRVNNKTYFNKECAACHGITTFFHWYSVMVCDDFSENSKIDFDQELQKFLENPTSSLCFIQFTPSYLTPSRKCPLHKKREIEPLNFHANGNNTDEYIYGMSISDIGDACMSDLYSPVFDIVDKKWYSNPFCYIYDNKYENEARCHMSSAPGGSEYMALLNPKAIDGLRSSKAELPKYSKMCLSDMRSDKDNLCREVTCPLGHIWGKDSTCTFIGQRVMFHGYSQFSVRILIQREVEATGNSSTLTNMDATDLIESMQLPRDWRLIFFGHPTDVTGNERKEVDWLMVGFTLRAFESSLDFMKNQLNKSFELYDGTKTQTYNQIIYPLSLNLTSMRTQDESSKKGGMRCPLKLKERNTSSTSDDLLSTCWDIYIHTPVAMDAMVISKLYYCNMVQLMPDEFEIQENGSLLYNKVGKWYLYEKEFVAFDNENGEKVVKVCIGESGFGSESRMESAGDNCHGLYSLFVMLVTLSCGMLVHVSGA